jgi:di/tricarboxylate transporter
LLGLITSTSFLSVWISNTATASMILPICVSISKQIAKFDADFKEKPGYIFKLNSSSSFFFNFNKIKMEKNSVQNKLVSIELATIE